MAKQKTEAEKLLEEQELAALLDGGALPETSTVGVSKSIWAPMETAPKDGAPVILKLFAGDGSYSELEAVWRATRAYDAKTTSWVTAGFWATRFGGAQIMFEPISWRPVQ